MGAGLLVAAAGFVVLTQVRPDSRTGLVLVGLGLVYLGMAAPSVLITDVILSAVPRERAGMASAMSETSHELGGALGIAVLGSVGALVYRHQVASAVGSDEAGTGTLAAALAAAARLSGPSAATAREAALESFTRALEVTAGVSAAIVALLALVAMGLRKPRRTSRV